MKTVIFRPELTPAERVKELKKVCAVSDYEKFNRNLTESEVEVERHAYAETGMRIEDVEYEAKESAESFKLKLKALKTEAEEKLARIRTGQREVYDEVFGVPDFEAGKMMFFDKYGEIVRTRNLVPDEYNGRMFNNANEPIKEEARTIDWDGILEDAEIVEDPVSDGTEIITDDDLPDFLKPDGGEGVEPSENESKTAKKPRKSKKGPKPSDGDETA